MYDRNQWYQPLLEHLKELDEQQELSGKVKLLFQVELGLRLLECLDLLDEPVLVLWALLSATPIRDERIDAFSKEQRHMLANARVLLPFAGRFNWQRALIDYASIPQHWRCYQIEAENLDRQMVYRPDQHRYLERLCHYDQSLEMTLEHSRRKIQFAQAGPFCFEAQLRDDRHEVRFELPERLASVADIPIPWFDQPRLRRPLCISHADLRAVALQLDARKHKLDPQETGLKQSVEQSSRDKGELSWIELVDQVIHYRLLHAETGMSDVNSVPLRLEGITHLAGMVGSGKSTLMKLLAAYAVLLPQENLRVTLVVGDTMSALNLADEFNQLLCEGQAPPVAVPLLGRSTRDLHLQRYYRSAQRREDHWGLRWLNTACPLQSLVPIEQLPEPIMPGKEPCEALYKPRAKPTDSKKYSMCPLFAVCPSKQVYRDLPSARIWITTPGALGRSGVPAQLEPRKMKLDELIYEQSDLVIFDEVDTIQEWFDNLYAAETKLTDNGAGLLDKEDIETAHAWTLRRAQPPQTQRWIESERQSLTAISQILGHLTATEHGQMLQHWVERSYFTALKLAYKLGWRLMGLPAWEECGERERLEAARVVQPVVDYFDKLTEVDPLTMLPPEPFGEDDPAYRLARIMRDLLAAGASTHNLAILEECKRWILKYVPNIQQTLSALEQRRQLEAEHPKHQNKKRPQEYQEVPDTLTTLAQRLEFVLGVMALDRHIRVVFYEWYNKPPNVTTGLNDQSLEHAPQDLADVLPVPPIGRVFGTYYSKDLERLDDVQGKKQHEGVSRLSLFGYTNIGRWYVLHFHELLTELHGQPGPNVLALSGTSWLPHSSRWHLASEPEGVLEPAPESRKAIASSEFSYLPQYVMKKGVSQPIRISGPRQKLQPLKELVRKLVGAPGDKNAPLVKELERLKKLAREQPEYWLDRERLLLLVNSYDQVQWVWRELSSFWWYGERNEVLPLRQSGSGDDEVLFDEGLQRSDIESFAQTKGKILIAPMQAIGRAYNILNSKGKAAFGAVYFLTRPMPYPFDAQALARELNRATLEWVKDEHFPAWQEMMIYEKALALRKEANHYWRKAELRQRYRDLDDDERKDLAASTAGLVIQACGRLLRGGVPFHAYFVDAAWAPETAKTPGTSEGPKTSLLAAMIEVLQEYAETTIGKSLYAPLVSALVNIDKFTYGPEVRGEYTDA